ncbi:Protein CBG06519 [Caenorhabditis briggsae]|uniref:Protein CBG06519 n=1 Tax=Caenorhabditis briggsae TaxID=6238 RepID=A8X2F2_CAEBR|nr:Protein CBG06519 [Caenorhabditis briggsae]CAP26812.1 Protein CBG06519 [Caenorhabditis briggsae]
MAEVKCETEARRGQRGRKKKVAVNVVEEGKHYEKDDGNLTLDNVNSYRKEEKEECGCQKGKAHYVEALGGECHDPKSLALSTLARNEKIASEDVNLMKCEEDFRKKLGKSERLEALRKFAGICPTWASKIMRNDWTEEELEWREAAESLKKEVMYRNQPQKAIIQEKYILVGQRMGLKSKAVFEVRTATISTWKQKFGWEKVEKVVVLVEWTKDDKQLKALVNLVEEIAKEVWELVVVPARMECGYDERLEESPRQWSHRDMAESKEDGAECGSRGSNDSSRTQEDAVDPLRLETRIAGEDDGILGVRHPRPLVGGSTESRR